MANWCQNNFWWIRVRGTVILSIWWQVIVAGLYSAGVVAIDHYVPELKMEFPSTLIGILGVVVALLLAFRTNNAYDRYWEGRKLWTTMTQDIRKITRAIWIGVKPDDSLSKTIVEKRSALNLLVAYAIATKHYLRDEYSYDYDDLRDLIRHLPRFSTPSSNLPLKLQLKEKEKKAQDRMAYEFAAPTNIPLEISYYLISYCQFLNEKKLIEPWALSLMQGAMSSLVDGLANFERILRTPIPLAYSIHLNHSVWLYILSLPFQLVQTLGWFTIPTVVLGAFCLIGILSIGLEIENPFGYDDNDLPLDDFCDVMRREIQTIVGNRMLPARDWIFSDLNYPLGVRTGITASELASKSAEEVQNILHRLAKDTTEVEVQRIDPLLQGKGQGPKDAAFGSTGYQRLG